MGSVPAGSDAPAAPPSGWRVRRPRALRIGAAAWVVAVALLSVLASLPTGSHAGAPGLRSLPAADVPSAAARGPSVRPATSSGSSNWTNLTGSNLANTPLARQGMMMAYDPDLSVIVLFGGQTSYGTALGDTWEFANNTWTNITANLTQAPPARWRGGLVYDPVMGDLVLFGGRACYCSPGTGASAGFLNDTWLFNSTGWWPLTERIAPPPSLAMPMVYDSTNQYVFDWLTLTLPPYLTEFWRFQNGSWANITGVVTGAPTGLVLYGADDPAAGYDVYFGGNLAGACGTPAGFALTLTYRNYTFTNLTWNISSSSSSVTPWDAMGSSAMTYDPVEQGVLMFGGYSANCNVTNGTYLFRNGTWTNLSINLSNEPPGRWDSGFAFDAVGNTDILFGGNHNAVAYPNYFIADTWGFAAGFVANASADPTIGILPLNVSFTSNPQGGTGPYVWNWTFGDGAPVAHGQNVSHLYTVEGQYTAHVRVTDARGDVADQSLAIGVWNPLVGNATATPTSGDAALAVRFQTNFVGGVPDVSYAWTFGDGGTADFAGNFTHTYRTNGTYTWNLTVLDGIGDAGYAGGRITVYPGLEVAVNATPTIGLTPLNVSFTAMPAFGKAPYVYNWSFGDGSANATTPSVNHTYLEAGNFTATLAVRDSGGDHVARQFSIEAVAPLDAVASVTPSAGRAPLEVQYSDVVTGGLGPYGYTWTFGPGLAPSTSPAGGVELMSAGNYTINVTTTDALGENQTQAFHVEVVRPLAGAVEAPKTIGVAPFAAAFQAVLSGGAGGLSYLWAFGDGTVSTAGPNVTHEYASPGTYAVHLTVTDAIGESVTPTSSVEVVAALSGQLSTNQSSFALGGSVHFSLDPKGGLAPIAIAWSGLPGGCAAGNVTSFDCTPAAAGNYSVEATLSDALGEVVTRTANFSVTATSTQPPPPPPGGGGSASTTLYLVVALLAVAVVAVTAVLWWRHRRSSGEPAVERAPTDDEVLSEPPS